MVAHDFRLFKHALDLVLASLYLIFGDFESEQGVLLTLTAGRYDAL